ncbi:MAG: hypothetical protein AAGG01_16945, partial [Planctomycetota bacterium]
EFWSGLSLATELTKKELARTTRYSGTGPNYTGAKSRLTPPDEPIRLTLPDSPFWTFEPVGPFLATDGLRIELRGTKR